MVLIRPRGDGPARTRPSTTPGAGDQVQRSRAALAFVTLFVAVGAHASYLVVYYRALGLDLAAVGGVISIAALAALLAAPAWGAVSDRLRGSPAILLLACVVAESGALVLCLAPRGAPVVLGSTLLAVGLAGVSPILDARALERSGDRREGYGPLRAWGSASYIVSAVATGVAIQLLGTSALFVVLTSAILATGLIGWRLVPIGRSPAGRAAGVLRPASRRRPLDRAGLTPFLVAGFVTWAPLAAVMSFYPLRLGELGAGTAIVGLSAGAGALVEVPIMLRFPQLVRRFGAGRLLVTGAALFVARALVAGLSPEPAVLVVASSIGGVGYALFLVGATTHVSLRAPASLAATAQGAFQGVSIGLGQVTAAVVGGAVAQRVGLGPLYLACAAIGAVGALLVLASVRTGPDGTADGRATDATP